MQELISVAEKIAARLIERKQTIAVAESSTGGLISAALLSVPGASASEPARCLFFAMAMTVPARKTSCASAFRPSRRKTQRLCAT